MNRLDGQTCFICGKYLLNYTPGDLAYEQIVLGGPRKAKPERYHLFQCPGCGRIGHKRCWYEHADKPVGAGLFRGPKGFEMKCPICGHLIAPLRKDKTDWRKGYEIPGHPDSELLELYIADVSQYKASSFIGKIGAAIGGFVKAVSVGFSSLTPAERSSIQAAADRSGQSMSDVQDRVFRLNISPQERTQLRELKCQHCGARLPTPGQFDDAIICEHCNTAHLL
ncbi:MAG: hypothetical protein QXS20_09055 [Candidatus Thorarchaeota archaeon]